MDVVLNETLKIINVEVINISIPLLTNSMLKK